MIKYRVDLIKGQGPASWLAALVPVSPVPCRQTLTRRCSIKLPDWTFWCRVVTWQILYRPAIGQQDAARYVWNVLFFIGDSVHHWTQYNARLAAVQEKCLTMVAAPAGVSLLASSTSWSRSRSSSSLSAHVTFAPLLNTLHQPQTMSYVRKGLSFRDP